MSDRLEVSIVDNPDHHRVEARTPDGVLAGYSQYTTRNGNIVFFHTEVGEAYEGQGVGSQISQGVVDFVRRTGHRVVPECPFVRDYMRKHPDTHDVLAPGASLDPDPEE
jgi:uncharacterized protein